MNRLDLKEGMLSSLGLFQKPIYVNRENVQFQKDLLQRCFLMDGLCKKQWFSNFSKHQKLLYYEN